MFLKSTVFFVVFLCAIHVVSAQILDDSTRAIAAQHGPHSTLFTAEDDIRYNRPVYHVIDTSIFQSHKRSWVERSNYMLQNLGLEGTTLRSVYYEPQQEIGVTPGFNGFGWYFKRPQDFTYYTTRSPYSRLSLLLGGGNRSFVDVEFSRSDSVTFNVGFSFKKLSVDKRIERLSRGDKRTENTQYDFYTKIRSRNLRYQLLANLSRSRHIFKEFGGIDTTGTDDFFSNEVSVHLKNAISDELRQNLHLYHQYSIRDYLEVYNVIDRYRQRNEYINDPLDDDIAFYDTLFISQDATRDSTDFRYLQMEAGVKGIYEGVFYNLYFKNRDYHVRNKYPNEIDTPDLDSITTWIDGNEKFLGANLGYTFNNRYRFNIGYERLDEERFKWFGEALGERLDLRLQHSASKPSFLQQTYISNSDIWDNNFETVRTTSARGKFSFRLLNSQITPLVRYDLVDRHIYMDTDTLFKQAVGNVQVLTPGIEYRIPILKNFEIYGNVMRTELFGDNPEVFAMPKWMVNAVFAYNDSYFQGALGSVMGVSLNYKEGYYGYNYYPVVQQYFLQNHTIVEGAPVMNAFFNFKLRRARITLKMNNLLDWFFQESYFVAPQYIALPATFDFGFTWWFFD